MLFSQLKGINVTEPDLKVDYISYLASGAFDVTITPPPGSKILLVGCLPATTAAVIRINRTSGNFLPNDDIFRFDPTTGSWQAATKFNPIIADWDESIYINKSANTYFIYAFLSKVNN